MYSYALVGLFVEFNFVRVINMSVWWFARGQCDVLIATNVRHIFRVLCSYSKFYSVQCVVIRVLCAACLTLFLWLTILVFLTFRLNSIKMETEF